MQNIKNPTLCVSIADGNEFPSWFNKWKNGYIWLSQSLQLPGTSLLGYKDEPVTAIFDLNDEYVGTDKNYIFCLSKVGITIECNKHNQFMIVFVIIQKPKAIKARARSRKQLEESKVIGFTYEIYCPIWQFPND